ncbi:Protein CBG22228 [Caenorhabditis briggsae]|uniref:Protein CBG22228 n=1 Tax=Caenorhabditis briggsae TaxID=6238 RepID=A8Y1U2_CAEBR|nr:Protein CBG22228 [Caenorhabditis briggsae]CAP38862.2 Protein CBG22228 [Caenorhabditis briggsae]
MSVLITGGVSKVSVKLAEELMKNGRNVVFLHNGTNDSISESVLKNEKFSLVNLSSVNEDAIKELIETKNIQTVFDGSLTTSDVLLAPLPGAKTLILGITSILDAMRKSTSPPSLVLISGEEIYGTNNRVETQPLEPTCFVGAAQMSVEAMVHSYAVSYRIPIVIGRLPRVLVDSQGELEMYRKNSKDFQNILSLSDAVQGLLSIEKLAHSQKPAEVFNISNSVELNASESRKSTMENSKILFSTSWKPSGLSTLSSESSEKNLEIPPVFLVFGANSELKKEFFVLVKSAKFVAKDSNIIYLREASDKIVIEEINTVKPSHLVYFGEETESFEGDCFTLHTNMVTNLYFPWLLASLSEKNGLHFTHFGNTEISQETSAMAVKGYTGKMLEYFQNTLRLGTKIDESTLELMKAKKTGGLNNNF